MRALFDYNTQSYKELCLIAVDYYKAEDAGTKVAEESLLSSHPLYNYLSEEERPRDILYYVCAMDDTLLEGDRRLFH